MARIYFPQYQKAKSGVELSVGNTVLDYVQLLGIEMASECGGRGECGKCIIRIDKGAECLNPKTEAENHFQLPPDERLACQTKIIDTSKDVVVFIKEFGKYSILSESVEWEVELNPCVYENNGEVIYHKAGDEVEKLDSFQGRIYGLAIDVGTTTLVFELVDLCTGQTLATIARQNPQISYGNDVISRIEYIMVDKKKGKYTSPEERELRLRNLQTVVMETINSALDDLEKERGEQIKRYIYDIVVVGNPTMRNVFFGIDVSSLGVIPYEPQQKGPVVRKAKDLGLQVFPAANVYGAPLIGGHAGADALANVICTRMYQNLKPSMIIDIGTNGEIMIGNKDRILTASCAAGGAYEGATIKSGVGAIEGAIKNVKITDGRVEYETIGNKPPKGICGSGLIDLLAELLRNGIMSKKAKLPKEFFLVDNVSITQQDIYQLITAKAGLRTDQDLLIKYYGITLEDIDKIYLAGAFGNYIDSDNAITIGLLPNAREKVVKIGNGALEGARQMLVSRQRRNDAERVAKKIKHIKPNEEEPDFVYLVAEKMYFEH